MSQLSQLWQLWKKDLFSLIFKLNNFVNFTPFSITGPATYSFIHCYNNLHSNWHVTTKWMGSTITQFIFLYILTAKESYNMLDYFCMGIIEKISFFFFEVEDPVRNQNFCAEIMRKWKLKAYGMGKKMLKWDSHV